MARRKAMLASLNMPAPAAPAGQALEGNASQAGTSAAAASEPAASSQAQRAQQAVSMEEEEEWRGLVCMVCKEGYASQPTELLAAYCYCMKLRSGEGFGAVPEVWMGPGAPARSDGLQAWMAVSHFNLIHSSCHQAARQADSALRAPKREWEGATLRNGETLCNNLLSVKAGGVSDTVHAAAVATFMEQLHQAPYRDTQAHPTTASPGSRRAQGSSPSSHEAPMQLGGIVGCMACLLQRLAYGESLSAESRGGGRESNARLVPYLFQLGHYFAGFCSESDLQSQKQLLDGLAGEQASTSPGGRPPSYPAHAPYLLLFSLFVRSPTQWSASRHSLLLSCLRFALSQAQPAGTAAPAAAEGSAVGLDSWQDASDEELWRCAFPMVRYFGLVHYLQDRLKGGSDDDWDARVGSRLEDLPAAVEVADGMLEQLNQLQASSAPSACFQAVGLGAALLSSSEANPAGALSDEACMAYIRQALI